jgi:predicted DCC family thiol-disulfide oxidoreductase YuxK
MAMDLIVYDGVCVLCSRWIKFVATRDHAARFRFVPLQSPYGRDLAVRHGISADDPQSVIAIVDGKALYRSDAALAVLARLPGYGWTKALRIIPRALRNAIYDAVARRRYRWFGRFDACPRPPADLAARVLEEAPQDAQP